MILLVPLVLVYITQIVSYIIIEFAGAIVAMPSHPHGYNHIDDAIHSRIIHYIVNEGLFDADAHECYNYPYKTIKSIIRAFKENGQLMTKHMRC